MSVIAGRAAAAALETLISGVFCLRRHPAVAMAMGSGAIKSVRAVAAAAAALETLISGVFFFKWWQRR